MDSFKFSSMEELSTYLASQEKRISDLEAANAVLIAEVKKRFVSKEEFPRAIDMYIPRNGLVSNSFLQRAFSVWGHHFVAQLLINIAITIIYVLIVAVILQKAILPWFLR